MTQRNRACLSLRPGRRTVGLLSLTVEAKGLVHEAPSLDAAAVSCIVEVHSLTRKELGSGSLFGKHRTGADSGPAYSRRPVWAPPACRRFASVVSQSGGLEARNRVELGASLISGLSGLLTRLLGDRAAAVLGARRRLPWVANRKLAGRLKEVIQKASPKGRPVERTLAYLCEQVPDLTLAAVEGFTFGSAEPTLDQAKSICTALGASFRYVWFGDGQPFASDGDDYLPTCEYLGVLRDSNANSVIFVRGDRRPHLGYVVIQYGEYRYRVLPDYWHVSSVNGNGGANALSQLAQLSENVYRTRTYEPVVRGIEVDARIAEGVLHGSLHPSALWSGKWKQSYWWDDLADVDHDRPCAKEYKARYDAEFFAAQKLIKWAREGSSAPQGSP